MMIRLHVSQHRACRADELPRCVAIIEAAIAARRCVKSHPEPVGKVRMRLAPSVRVACQQHMNGKGSLYKAGWPRSGLPGCAA